MTPSRRWLAAVLLAAACGPAKETPAADSAAAAAPAPAPAGPQTIVTVLYQWPKDTVAFEKYYAEVHLPLLAAGQAEIGFTTAELTRFTAALDRSKPPFYRQAKLYFPTAEAAAAGTSTAAFRKVGDDLANFATGGLVALVATETSPAATGACGALVTVIYEQPKDSAAFEGYYAATHIPLVGQHQAEIGFTRAELTKFASNLDGSAPAKYRQAVLCFDGPEAVTKGAATPGFQAVGDDLAKFATGGLVGMIGVKTN